MGPESILPTAQLSCRRRVDRGHLYIATVVDPLIYLTGDVEFVWGNAQKSALYKVKEIIGLAPLLVYPNFKAPFILETDASNYATGAVLL